MAKRAKSREGMWDKFSRIGIVLVLLYVLFIILGFTVRLIFFHDENNMSIVPDSYNVVSAEETASNATLAVSETVSTSNAETATNIRALSMETNYLAVLEGNSASVAVNMSTVGEASLDEIIWESSDTSIATVDENGIVTGISTGTATITAAVKNATDIAATLPVTVRHLETIDGCTYIDGILVANKSYGLPADYNPGLEDYVREAFETMQSYAYDDGVTLYIGSEYRSYDYQVSIYNNYVDSYGWELADTFSARPGYSEHQTGLTIDCNTIDDAFGDTEEAVWLAEHCAEYGFIIRFPEGKEDITGYKYEPWHIRYVGVEVAQEITDLGITLEEYLGIDSVYANDWAE